MKTIRITDEMLKAIIKNGHVETNDIRIEKGNVLSGSQILSAFERDDRIDSLLEENLNLRIESSQESNFNFNRFQIMMLIVASLALSLTIVGVIFPFL